MVFRPWCVCMKNCTDKRKTAFPYLIFPAASELKHTFGISISVIHIWPLGHWGSPQAGLLSTSPLSNTRSICCPPRPPKHALLWVWTAVRTVAVSPQRHSAATLPSWRVLVSDWNRHVHPAGQKHHLHQELHFLSVPEQRGEPDQAHEHDSRRQQDLRQPQRGVLQVSVRACGLLKGREQQKCEFIMFFVFQQLRYKTRYFFSYSPVQLLGSPEKKLCILVFNKQWNRQKFSWDECVIGHRCQMIPHHYS